MRRPAFSFAHPPHVLVFAFVIGLVSIFSYGPSASGSGFQVGAGGITPHYNVGPGYHHYCNQYKESGTIFNRTFYLRLETNRWAVTGMKGQDSICSPIQGLFLTYKVFEGRWFSMAFDLGGYRFNMKNWVTWEANTPANMVAPHPVYGTLGPNFYFVPIVAPEFSLALFHAGSLSLWINALVTPFISNISISLKETF